jgi:hypothetical protein
MHRMKYKISAYCTDEQKCTNLLGKKGVILRDMMFGNVTPCILVDTMSLVFPPFALRVEL